MLTECGVATIEVDDTLNVAVRVPRLRTEMSPDCCRSCVNSSTPKLRFVSASVSLPSLPGTCVVATTLVWVAGCGCTRPPPPTRTENPVSFDASAVFTIAARMSPASQPGCDWTTNAAAPVVWGAAIEVPERNSPPFPVPTAVEKMLTPGALRSGFRLPSPKRGPPEVKPANALKVGLAMVLFVSVAGEAAAAVTAAAAVEETPRNGIVTLNRSPVSGFPVMGPSNGGSPAALLITSTAAAPACCPNTARATRAQVPRTVTTSLPVTPAAVYSALLQPKEIVPLGFRRTTICRLLLLAGAMPFASIAVTFVPVDSARLTPGNVAVESTAATLIALSPDAGEPVMRSEEH